MTVPNKNECSSKQIVIEHINIRSLRKNFGRFSTHVSEKIPDIMCVSETWKINTKDGLSINGYNMIHKQRKNDARGGGVAIYFKDNLEKFRHRKIETSDKNIEELWVTFKHNKLKILIGVIYRPPNYALDKFNVDLCNTLQCLQKEINSLPTFILGDFNLNFAKKEKYCSFFEIMDQYGLDQKITDYTRETDKSKTIIDLIFTNIDSIHLSCGIHMDNLSDHYAVYANYFYKNSNKVKNSFSYRPISNMDTDKFSSIFHENMNKSIVNVDPSTYVFLIQNCLNKSLEMACPLKIVKCTRPFAPWMKETSIVKAKKERTRALTVWRKDKNNIDKKTVYKKDEKRSMYLSTIANRKNSRLLWSVIKNMQHKEVTKFSINIDNFNIFYCETSFRYCQKMPPSDDNLIEFINSVGQNGFSFHQLEYSAVEYVIKNLKRNKIDCNGINSNIVQLLHKEITPFIMCAFNYSILHNKYPDALKVSSVRPIPKISDPTQLNDFRPICLQPMLSKIFESCLNQQLNVFLHNNNILSSNQFGFRAKYSSQMLLHLIDNKIKDNLSQGFLTILIFLDFSKAFDTISHLLLLKKLASYGFSHDALKLMMSYLRTRKVFTTFAGKNSKENTILTGVPQGSILGPCLFNVYVSDFINAIPSHISLYQFADDCQLIITFPKTATFKEIMEEVTNVLECSTNYASKNDLCLNMSKTQILPIYNRNSSFSKMPFFSSTNSYFVKEAKNLGIYFDFRNNWNNHFTHMHEIFTKTFYQLKSMFKMYTKRRDLLVRKQIIYSVLLPKISYCFTLFYDHTKTTIKYYQKWNRMIASLMTLHYCGEEDVEKCNLKSFETNLQEQIFKFIRNPLVQYLKILNITKAIQSYNSRSNNKSHVATTSAPNSFSHYAMKLINALNEEDRNTLLKTLC